MSIYTSAIRDTRVREYLPATRIIAASEDIKNPECIIGRTVIQGLTSINPVLTMKAASYVILDFGREINGGLRIVSGWNEGKSAKIRIRFGESVSETMHTPNNDHAMHEILFDIATMGASEIGNTGFRFVRIDIPEDAKFPVGILNIMAVLLFRDLPYVGSFKSSDERLNTIWKTGAYTSHLNMQDYLYDGIKRDRLVWMGDMNPEIRVICSVFDDTETVEKTLRYSRDNATLPNFMNGISAYSLWWVISQRDWYMYKGNLEFLKENHPYLVELMKHLSTFVAENGVENLPKWRFLDWPTNGQEVPVHAGLQALLAWAFESASATLAELGDYANSKFCSNIWKKLITHNPDAGNSKQAHALKAIAGLDTPENMNKISLAKDPTSALSAFFGYYVIEARAMAGDFEGTLDTIRKYWGGMLDMGATTFWEDFDLTWTENAFRIDELPVPGKKDIHGDFGNYCYQGFRHSLCHGWSSGPTAWLSKHILGITPLKPGFKEARVKPLLPGLDYLEGAMPTPFGPIKLKAEKLSSGKLKVDIDAPEEVKLIKD